MWFIPRKKWKKNTLYTLTILGSNFIYLCYPLAPKSRWSNLHSGQSLKLSAFIRWRKSVFHGLLNYLDQCHVSNHGSHGMGNTEFFYKISYFAMVFLYVNFYIFSIIFFHSRVCELPNKPRIICLSYFVLKIFYSEKDISIS